MKDCISSAAATTKTSPPPTSLLPSSPTSYSPTAANTSSSSSSSNCSYFSTTTTNSTNSTQSNEYNSISGSVQAIFGLISTLGLMYVSLSCYCLVKRRKVLWRKCSAHGIEIVQEESVELQSFSQIQIV